MVWENDSPRVTSWIEIVHTSESATTSEIEACMWSPGSTVMLLIVSDGAGTSSHHAEYDAAPVESTSCLATCGSKPPTSRQYDPR